MKTQVYIVILTVVGFLALFAMGQMLAAEAPVPPLPDSLPDLSVKETYDWLGKQFSAALRLPDKKVRLERIAKLLDQFCQSHPDTYEAARATTLGGDVEHELGRHQAAITFYSEALQAFGQVRVLSNRVRKEYLGYLYAKSGESHTALGNYQDAVDMYKKAIIGQGTGVPFSTVAVHALIEPLTGLYGREKRWVEYQNILEELLERADEVPRITLSQVVYQYVENADRLRAMGKIDQKEHWRSLALVRKFLPLLLDAERKAVSRHLDAIEAAERKKGGAQEEAKKTSLGREEKRQYNHFLFVRHNKEDNRAVTDTLVMAKVTSEGFELKDFYTKTNLNVGLNPLCVMGGKVYLVKMGDLVSIDIATGKSRQIASPIGPHCFDSGRLYFFARGPDEDRLCVYDFHKGAYREIISIASAGWGPGTIAISPDHKRLAYFEHDYSKKAAFLLLNVVDIEAKSIQQPCPSVQYICASGGLKPNTPPFIWLDAENILFVRWDRNKRANLTTTANVVTGEMKDIVVLPGEPFRLRHHLLPPSKVSAAHLNLYEGPPRSDYGYYARGQYRIDLEGGRLIEDDSIGGEYCLCNVKGAEGLYHRARLIEERKGVRQVAVSPDGKHIIWRSGYSSKSKLCYYDTKSQAVRTVTKGWFGDSFLWFAEENLKPQVEPAEFQAGWALFASEPWPPPRPPDTRKNINDFLTFSLSSDKKRYKLHEPVELTLTITNNSDMDVEMHPPSFEYGSVELGVRYPGVWASISNFHRQKQLEKVVAKPGATVKRVEILEVAHIGEYRIDGEFIGTKKPLDPEVDWYGWFKANAISFTVEPSPDAEELLKSKMKRLLARAREEYLKNPDDVSQTSPLFTMTSTLRIIREIGPDAGLHLISAIKQESDEGFILVLYKPLVGIASPEALAFYQECLKHRDARVRRMACLGLFELHRQGTSLGDEALEVLLASLKSEHLDVRRTVAKLLARIYDVRVKRAFEAAVEDEIVSTASARYLAAYEGLGLAEWLARAAEESTHARYLAAKSIIGELEEDWHMKKGELPSEPWSDVSKSPEMLAQFRQILLVWQEWARENSRASSRFFNKGRHSWAKTGAD